MGHFFNNLSIKRKMMLAISATTLFVLILAAALWSLNDWQSSRQAAVDNVRVLAGVIGNNVTAALVFRNEEDAHSTLQALRVKPEIISAAAYDQQGELFAAYVQQGADPVVEIPKKLADLPKMA